MQLYDIFKANDADYFKDLNYRRLSILVRLFRLTLIKIDVLTYLVATNEQVFVTKQTLNL